MWMWVLGVPLGIMLPVMILPSEFGQFSSIFMGLAATLGVVTWLSWQRGLATSKVLVMGFVTALLVGLGIGSLVKQRLSPWALEAGATYYLSGELFGVPQVSRFNSRYRIRVDCLGQTALDCSVFTDRLPGLWSVVVELSTAGQHPLLRPGQRIQVPVQPTAIRVQSSPAAFNVQRWLLSNHVVARVKLKKGAAVTPLGETWWSMDRVRTELNTVLARRMLASGEGGLSSYPVILALVSGDRSLMGDPHWEVFNRTGTTHLVAISGLHVGLVATLVTFLVLPLFRRWHGFTNRYPASHGALVVAWIACLFYSGLAGFAIPTQRALIMLSVYVLLKLTGRAQHLWFGLLVALTLVLLWDPVACLSLGFWLSFVAVYLILWLIGGGVSARSALSQWSQVQLGLFVGLAPALLYAVHSVSLVSAFTNALAIPVIGFVVVPLSLLWVTLWSLCGESAVFLLDAALWVSDGLLWFLQLISGWRYSVWTVGERSLASLILAMVGVLWLVSAGLPGRAWGVVLLLPMLLPQSSGNGLYIMGSGSGRMMLQSKSQVWSLSRSHWPQPIARWQSDLLSHWGVMIPMGEMPLHESRALWLARGGVFSEFELDTDAFGSRAVQSIHYGGLCSRAQWHSGGVQFERYPVAAKPERCALGLTWGQTRLLYWPLDTQRDQRQVIEQLAGEHFDAIVLDLGKGKAAIPELLSLLGHSGELIAVKPLPEPLQEQVLDRGIPLHVIAEDGYYYRALPEGAGG
ncbi:MAG: ComEC/Rec2 family competence protein [Pseudomonadota bacterium]|nr:ComEC/Rec2 family competence protein [Pseudomonadota bacterium]